MFDVNTTEGDQAGHGRAVYPRDRPGTRQERCGRPAAPEERQSSPQTAPGDNPACAQARPEPRSARSQIHGDNAGTEEGGGPVNDYGKSRDDMAPELIEQLNLLEAVDRRLTPEHLAGRFRELLDDIGDEGHAPGEDGPAEEARGSLQPAKSSVSAEPDRRSAGRGALEASTVEGDAGRKVGVQDRPEWMLPAVPVPDARLPVGPVHRLIFA